jgi:hypothetical protein
MINLTSIGMEKGLLYETIITTKNPDNTPNAAPIGVTCKDTDEIVIHLHQGSHTVKNIKNKDTFIVNILNDPILFAQSTLGNPPSESFIEYQDNYALKNSEAFFKVQITKRREVEREDQFGISKTTIINAHVKEIIQNQDCVAPLNRAIYGVIEALVYLTRIDMVNGDTEKLYKLRIKEIFRIINKVGGSDHKEAMKMILEEFNKKN